MMGENSALFTADLPEPNIEQVLKDSRQRRALQKNADLNYDRIYQHRILSIDERNQQKI